VPDYARRGSRILFGERSGQVAAGIVPTPSAGDKLRLDMVVYSSTGTGGDRRILSLGKAKWNKVMGLGHLRRLERARDLLAAKGYQVRDAIPACYSGAGFTSELTGEARRGQVLLVGPDQLYAP
jgi:hypothetical protein